MIALAETTVHRRLAHAAGQRDPSAAVARFLLDVQARMPDYLRLPFRLLTLAFDAAPLPLTGRCFHRLSPERRLQCVDAWKGSRIEARRRLMEFYESLAVFSLYSNLYGQDYAPAAVAAQDQDQAKGAGDAALA
ncbi:hypothetical protein [Falsiroseomonas oryzae]|uniref:hypothetical protein n=1 Tax=Falsiroseomonas oryzae TaxID=2766473 RepID=UPI0022EA9425|nr:hypothetical protein [Roseomonas sp. MO-31]